MSRTPGAGAGLDLRTARALAWASAAAISSSIMIMIGASLLRSSWMTPPLVLPTVGPPWELTSVHISVKVVAVALWLAALLAGGGVAAGLAAISQGARVSARALLVTGLLAVAVLTVLPPAGSTDVLDYAAYGRTVVLGHSPYVMAPYQLRMLHDAYSKSVPVEWEHQVTLYGPLATAEQFVAAVLGGSSAVRIVFWLKLGNALAFGAVALAAHRVLRSVPAARLRAHLLWTLNPLLLWGLIAAGHLDVLAAAAGMLGLLTVGSANPGPMRAAMAGVFIGVAADIKIYYLIFGLALVSVLRRSPRDLAAAVGAALAVLVPTYTWFGPPAIKALLARRDKTTSDNFYQLLSGPHGYIMAHLSLLAGLTALCLAVLTLRRLPTAVQAPPAIRAALALSVAWLFVWPYQLPWYDAMIVCLLVLYPASRLDWLVLARLTAGTIALMPGNPWAPPGHLLARFSHDSVVVIAPVTLLAVTAGLAALGLSGRWKLRQAGNPDPDTATIPAATAVPVTPLAGG
jgi:hypothetical protein